MMTTILNCLNWTGWTLLLLLMELVGTAIINRHKVTTEQEATRLIALWVLTIIISLALFLITR